MSNAPSPAAAEFQQAVALLHRGQLARARASCRNLLSKQPNHFDALHLLGLIALNAGDAREAVDLITRAIEIFPGNAAAFCNRGSALQQLTEFGRALNDYDRAIALDRNFAEAHLNRAMLLQHLGMPEAALASYNQAILIQPALAEAYRGRGMAQRELNQLPAAVDSYDRAIALRPGYVEAYINRGNVYRDLQNWDLALENFNKAISIDARCAEAHCHRGNVYNELNQLDAAVASYDKAIAVRPDYVEAHCNKGVALLLTGKFDDGWKSYEWRRKRHPGAAGIQWTGKESLAGKTVLLYAEQGYGDTLQFCRYAALAAAAGARVILQVQPPLLGLMRGLDGVERVIAGGLEAPAADFQCPLLSLPFLFKTRSESIPAVQRYLRADAQKIALWNDQLGPRDKPRIGLAWAGSAVHRNNNRVLPLPELMRILPSGFDYVVLQKELSSADRDLIRQLPGAVFAEQLVDFSDTAALCECIDLVISIDTSVAHLSAALGRPTWIMLAFNPDWRWLLGRDDSPWYPAARLYRQESMNDWDTPLQRVGADLVKRFPASWTRQNP
jgi:tetratricopeptide (TPR) repeat protein